MENNSRDQCDRYGNMMKLRCHSCKREAPLDCLVQCKSGCCCLLYCRRCLTSRYKYSRAKAANLPTAHWKCPVCSNRCHCETCVSEGYALPVHKTISKKTAAASWYRKKRIRRNRKVKLKRDGQTESYTSPAQPSSRLDSAEVPSLPTCQPESYPVTPLARRCLPPVTSTL